MSQILLHSSPYLTYNFSDTHHGNVLFQENANGLHSAHFVDWGNAKAAERDSKGALNQKTLDLIVRFYFW